MSRLAFGSLSLLESGIVFRVAFLVAYGELVFFITGFWGDLELASGWS